MVAEGIETEPQYAILKDLGCEFAQGFHLSRRVSGPRGTLILDAKMKNALPPIGTRRLCDHSAHGNQPLARISLAGMRPVAAAETMFPATPSPSPAT